jgi:hypothetical protein
MRHGGRCHATAHRPRAAATLTGDDVLVVIGLGAFLVALWPTALALRGPQPLVPAVLAAHVTGMRAGYGVGVLIALMSVDPPSSAASARMWPVQRHRTPAAIGCRIRRRHRPDSRRR